MDTNTTATTPTYSDTNTLSRAARAITSAVVAAGFVLVLAFGAPDTDSNRWNVVDAHSDIGHHVVLDSPVQAGK